MASANKYAFAQQAIIGAVDQDAFDSMFVGLMAFPSGDVAGPACLLNIPVACAAPGLAQVPLTLAGVDKSSASSGVRHNMYSWLTSNAPVPGNGDGNPTYEALQSGINALKALSLNGKRMLFYITDGGASCASVSTRPGYTDANGCPDWEHPDSIFTLIKNAHDDPTTPISTFVVGVPGADGQGGSNPNQPPYHVRAALSAYAYAGSPETVDPSCTGKTYAQGDPDPAVSCHFDMTTNYSAQRLTDAINQIRGKLLGCIFDLPKPEGGTIDPNKVNVEYSGGDAGLVNIPKRGSSSDPCDTGDGCWDYTNDGRVELFGKACTDVKVSLNAKVQIIVGCKTVIK